MECAIFCSVINILPIISFTFRIKLNKLEDNYVE